MAGVPGQQRRIGRWLLEHKIGAGSFAVVWKARDEITGQHAAVKEINTGKLNQKLQESLASEVAVLERSKHDNIVRLLDLLKAPPEEGPRIYLVLEYCSGGDLSAYLRRYGRVSEAVARYFAAQLAAGLRELRRHNIIHRDLKPQNLLLSDTSASPTLKIADFGFARCLEPQGLAETLCGSPLYMAPEILQLQKYDAKADLWSVGTILFELLCGKPPFNGANHIQLLRNIEAGEARLPDAIASRVSADCAALLHGLLRRNPLQRLSWQEFFSHPFVQGGAAGAPGAAQEVPRPVAPAPPPPPPAAAPPHPGAQQLGWPAAAAPARPSAGAAAAAAPPPRQDAAADGATAPHRPRPRQAPSLPSTERQLHHSHQQQQQQQQWRQTPHAHALSEATAPAAAPRLQRVQHHPLAPPPSPPAAPPQALADSLDAEYVLVPHPLATQASTSAGGEVGSGAGHHPAAAEAPPSPQHAAPPAAALEALLPAVHLGGGAAVAEWGGVADSHAAAAAAVNRVALLTSLVRQLVALVAPGECGSAPGSVHDAAPGGGDAAAGGAAAEARRAAAEGAALQLLGLRLLDRLSFPPGGGAGDGDGDGGGAAAPCLADVLACAGAEELDDLSEAAAALLGCVTARLSRRALDADAGGGGGCCDVDAVEADAAAPSAGVVLYERALAAARAAAVEELMRSWGPALTLYTRAADLLLFLCLEWPQAPLLADVGAPERARLLRLYQRVTVRLRECAAAALAAAA